MSKICEKLRHPFFSSKTLDRDYESSRTYRTKGDEHRKLLKDGVPESVEQQLKGTNFGQKLYYSERL
ncbi:hypothetical protein TNCV_2140631 [Trichonephila clavipes]|uniref:Uncharacterized protein n=1 Tax=Trichonephila clavipes TaxID=2585209 RepID=A0A8X6VAS0_TRICX|nr:hypothetical protein TNCV_2140631 [Trichonephila clavipes]